MAQWLQQQGGRFVFGPETFQHVECCIFSQWLRGFSMSSSVFLLQSKKTCISGMWVECLFALTLWLLGEAAAEPCDPPWGQEEAGRWLNKWMDGWGLVFHREKLLQGAEQVTLTTRVGWSKCITICIDAVTCFCIAGFFFLAKLKLFFWHFSKVQQQFAGVSIKRCDAPMK